ncbi:MAG: fused MFS/spermidine synthase [Rhodocyclaceae bacterium]|nr:fused MFS/spermidine synthase [Rhodocyclaceae bacterium]MBX3670297.1 fused MFS/spermidine synthase [Rhodocyclaceae bacterium]
MAQLLFAATIFSSAFLLFLVQPIISKQILPWFGGSAAVWATCMVFFQVTLLLGYAYSDWVTRNLRPRAQVLLHVALLAASLVFLPIVPAAAWKPQGAEDPMLRILGLLAGTIGLPYLLLSTTGPLVQSWVARTLAHTHVYRLFSLSNLASMLALLAYPFLIEPRAALALQANGWSAVYAAFTAFCAFSGFYFMRHAHALGPAAHLKQHSPETDWDPAPGDYLMWLALSAMGSWLLLAMTNHITQNIAAIPLLWLLPLTLYLLTFVLCFESDRWYSRRRFLLPVAVLVLLCAYGLQAGGLGFDLKVAIPVYLLGLFGCCMFCHGELAQMRPGPRHLTRFYLMVSVGGALGGVCVGLGAPRILPAYYETGLGLILLALLAALVLRASRPAAWGAAAVAGLCALALASQVRDDTTGTLRMSRNFYGTLLTVDVRRDERRDDVRQLYHGSIKHGEQYLLPERRMEPTTYYGATSGIGLAILNSRMPNKKVGLIGLGAGTLAVYGQPGDHYLFYEINPQVVDFARDEFTFMRDSRARVDNQLGDARLSLERAAPENFDVLAIDAFTGDSIPAHLITREAMQVYLRNMAPRGIIAFHVTNKFVRLAPMVELIARDLGLASALIHDDAENSDLRRTDWVLVAQDASVLAAEPFASRSTHDPAPPGLKLWTDDFNNIFDVLR